ncbi:MAG: D-alanine--D-alanine ligase, partial [Fimbriimonadales bacterium]
KELDCPVFRRSQVLGWLLKGYKVIAVTGTHGKTTTTGMTGAALVAAGLDPLVVVGANIPEWGGPVREGKGDWAVVEACEAYDSFHDLDPYHVVLTNLELDHVDFHGTWENLRDSVVRFVNKLPREGILFYCKEDPGAKDIAKGANVKSHGYDRNDLFVGLGEDTNLLFYSPTQRGIHNLLNACGAATVMASIAPKTDGIVKAICDFRGAERRQQVLRGGDIYSQERKHLDSSGQGVEWAITVVDDYAHHPTEVEATLKALRETFVGFDHESRLIAVFQPHLYSRTAPLIEEFARALSLADIVFITDIYPAREAPMPGVSSARIAELIKKPVYYVPCRHLLPREVKRVAKPGDVVVGMGAGNISDFAPGFIRELDRKGPIKVAVCYGGDSAEREVSLHSGRAIHAALARKGYDAKLADVSETLLKSGDLSAFVGDSRPDLAFLAVHGTNAEDGAIQGLFQLLHVPYTGSSLQSSAIAMDKQRSKQILAAVGIPVPQGELVTGPDQAITITAPLIVKPNAQGSTVGLSFVHGDAELPEALAKALQYDTAALVEEWIVGMEISVPVLGDQVLPPVEIVPRTGQYDFASKYLPGATEEICPARLSAELTARVQDLALRSHQALGCSGATRTDMMIRGDEIFVLEVNTLPGMTGTSLLPNSAAAAGISFDDLVDWIAQDALQRHAKTTRA